MPLATAQPQHEEDIWQHYDPIQVKQALQDSAGALAGVDTATLLSDITAERTQNPHDRSL
jgi:hypothetical protein